MPTVTSDQIPGLLTAAGTVKNNGAIDEARYRAHPVSDPLGTVVATSASQAVLFSGWYKQNGSAGDETAPHPLGTLTSRNTTALLTAEWRAALAKIPLEDCYFRMLAKHEIGRGCGFDVDFPDHRGDFVVWGSARDQVDGFGNAVSPPVGTWIGSRPRAVLDISEGISCPAELRSSSPDAAKAKITNLIRAERTRRTGAVDLGMPVIRPQTLIHGHR